MDIQQVNKTYYDKLYKRKNPLISLLHSAISFDQQSKSKLNYKVIKEYLKDRMLTGLNVLDCGFGHGSLLLKYGSRHRLYGSDISLEAVKNFPRVAALVGKEVHTATADDFGSLYGKVSFDVISLSHIIEHVEDDELLIRQLTGMLADSGIILINVPINEVWTDPKHVRTYDMKYLEGLLTKCGLKMVFSLEADKLTSFFLTEEKVKKAGRLKILALKSLRAIFAVLPPAFGRMVESIFLRHHRNQQLIVLSSRQ